MDVINKEGQGSLFRVATCGGWLPGTRHSTMHRMSNRTQDHDAMRGDSVSKLRITKKLAPAHRGAIQLHRQFGPALVCVRHRVDAEARFRYTTVELLVERSQIQTRQPQLVHLRVNANEYALRTVLRAAGARWDSRLGLWQLPKRVATVLHLSHRIVRAR